MLWGRRFDKVRAKNNALEIIAKELKSKEGQE